MDIAGQKKTERLCFQEVTKGEENALETTMGNKRDERGIKNTSGQDFNSWLGVG